MHIKRNLTGSQAIFAEERIAFPVRGTRDTDATWKFQRDANATDRRRGASRHGDEGIARCTGGLCDGKWIAKVDALSASTDATLCPFSFAMCSCWRTSTSNVYEVISIYRCRVD